MHWYIDCNSRKNYFFYWFISSFNVLLCNHTFQTNPNNVTNLSKLFNYTAPALLLRRFFLIHFLIHFLYIFRLEPQTIESINLLRSRKTPFVIALNKVDVLYGWKAVKDQPIRKSLSQQTPDVLQEFETRTQDILVQLAEQSLNSKLYYENDDFRRNVSVVPTSAITGEGVQDILLLVVQITQDLMTSRLMYSAAFECTLLEVKVIPGLGTTIDVVLINGVIHDSDTIVVCGINGPIVTPIRALLTPKAMKELRIKSDYTRNKTIKAAMGIKISAQNLDGAIAGTNVMVYRKEEGDNLDEIKKCVMKDFDSVMGNISTVDRGVYVQASTLGALEALLEFLKSEDVNIPVCGVSIGPVHKKDVMKASVMLEHKPEWVRYQQKIEKMKCS